MNRTAKPVSPKSGKKAENEVERTMPQLEYITATKKRLWDESIVASSPLNSRAAFDDFDAPVFCRAELLEKEIQNLEGCVLPPRLMGGEIAI